MNFTFLSNNHDGIYNPSLRMFQDYPITTTWQQDTIVVYSLPVEVMRTSSSQVWNYTIVYYFSKNITHVSQLNILLCHSLFPPVPGGNLGGSSIVI